MENDLFKQDWRSHSRSHIFQYVVLKWAFCFLIGALAGGTGFLTNLAVENVAGIKFVVTSNMMLAQR
jgi:chloride channel 7